MTPAELAITIGLPGVPGLVRRWLRLCGTAEVFADVSFDD